MNETDRQTAIVQYLEEITNQFYSGHAREHSYRPALERLMMSFDKVHAVNEPKHSEHGAPDFVFLSDNNKDLILGYAEAKDVNVSLDKTEKTEQMGRYSGYANLFLTDYLEFRFFRNGEKYKTISLGHIEDNKLHKTPENSERLMRELEAFLEQTPEQIKNGKRLAQIMGGKARRIRDNVAAYLENEDEHSTELTKIYEMMKKMLVHDLEPQKFADMYAQTLVYGLFVARYGDKTPDTFSRAEARDLVPKSNPFLRHFFDHIVGPDFDTRLGYIVDELCEIFLVSNVNGIVHKHLQIADDTTDAKDPIIHFYEDFLQEYDPAERKKMGAYYTPIPVVRFIVHQVDRILKEDFGIVKGLASDEAIDYWVETGQDHRADKRKKLETGYSVRLPRVQVLDPAVGTATFLNETIKHIHKSFAGQEGRWASYVNDNLLKRLYGFELMMAPYTIAHLKLGMTLQEMGVDKLNERLNVFLTNTLEEGIPQQSSLFDFGLAGAVSEESRLAAEVKSEKPVMVVIGNPPYSVSSNNKSQFIENLVADYKKDLNERNIQPLSDDYIKFIRFAEDMIEKNGSGVVAMITNNGYIDGLIHRKMRKHLLDTFDKLHVLDLHGGAKRQMFDNNKSDTNIFDIQQGVSIILALKTDSGDNNQVAEVNFSEIYGSRTRKFGLLNSEDIEWTTIQPVAPYYFFKSIDLSKNEVYQTHISLRDLFKIGDAGIASYRDAFAVGFDKPVLEKRMQDFFSLPASELMQKYGLKESNNFSVSDRRSGKKYKETLLREIQYRPFDKRFIYYSGAVVDRLRYKTTRHMLKDNIGIAILRNSRSGAEDKYFIVDCLADKSVVSSLDNAVVFPLYTYDHIGNRTPNFNIDLLDQFSKDLLPEVRKDLFSKNPESVVDYIYAVLSSKKYRQEYRELLAFDFPRIPAPTQVEFDRLVPLGHKLRELHLMKSPLLDSYDTTYPVQGSGEVEKIIFVSDTTSSMSGRVYINDTQYFGNVPEIAWNFYIGGYQPAQKWLKDRKGQKLSNLDLDHYQKIIKILLETNRVMKEIDNV